MRAAWAVFVTNTAGVNPQFCTVRATRRDCVKYIERAVRETDVPAFCFYAQRYAGDSGEPVGRPVFGSNLLSARPKK